MKKRTFVVIGLDRFGYNLAINLEKAGNEVVGIDEDEEKVNQIADQITHAAIGDPTDANVLRALGVSDTDVAVVALTNDIQSGVLVTMMLKEMGMKKVIAESTSDIHGRILQKVGADKIIFPEKDMGERLAKSLNHSDIMDYIDLSDEYSIVEIRMPKEWINKSLIDLKVRTRYKVNVIACRNARGELTLTPDPSAPLSMEDILVVIGKNKDIEKIIKD